MTLSRYYTMYFLVLLSKYFQLALLFNWSSSPPVGLSVTSRGVVSYRVADCCGWVEGVVREKSEGVLAEYGEYSSEPVGHRQISTVQHLIAISHARLT